MPHRIKALSANLREGKDEIIRRWLERISARVTLDKNVVFPSETLIDDIPLLIEGIARHLEDDAVDISSTSVVVGKARELGRLRFQQSLNARQILWEYDVLGSLMLQYLDETNPTISLPEAFVRRLMTALGTLERHTVEEYLLLAEAHGAAREDQLRSFNRALSHELRSHVAVILGAGGMLKESFIVEDQLQRDAFVSMIIDNGERIDRLIGNLLQLTTLESDARRNRHVQLQQAAEEVARRLRRFAESKGVRVRIDSGLPNVEVSAAAIDLALTNLIANGIKYADPQRDTRYVAVSASLHADMVVIEVTDNGTGIPEEDRVSLFAKFFRSERHANVEGTGLGLSLVRETIERLGGRVWADFPDTGETVFAFALPARRVEDAE